jgi:ribosomal protein S18 acetylase RimI-like enzyme
MTIRPALADDIPEVRTMLREYVAWVGIDLGFQEIDNEIAALPGAYDPPGGALFVAEEGHHLIGMIAMRHLDGSTAEMKRLFVRPEGRGRGCAKALVHRVLDEARRRDYEEIRLDTLPMMSGAQSLYESLGFEETDPYYDTPIAGTRFMAKKL